jgi:hypothetical protein
MLLLAISIACHAQPSISSLRQPMIQESSSNFNSSFKLDEWISLRDLSMQEIQNRFSISEKNIDKDANYIKLKHVTEFHNPKTHPGYFYFRDGKFALLYVGRCKQLEQIELKELQQELGGLGIEMRSRSGKQFNHHVYPEKGVAFTVDRASVRFLEIFPPTSLEVYKSEIYEEPSPFIK